MAYITDSLLIDFLLLFTTILFLVYKFLSNCNNYWKERGVPYVKPLPFFGNLLDTFLGRRSLVDIHLDIYKKLEGERFGGYFELLSPVLNIRDPELIEKILVKDFSHFVDRGTFTTDVDKEPLSAGLSILNGNQWRNMRHKLTPTFTTGKLKGMFEQIYNCGEELLQRIKEMSRNGEPIEAKKVLSLFTTDVIATCAFGLQIKHDSEEGKIFRKMAEEFFAGSAFQMLKFLLANYSQKLSKLFGGNFFPKSTNEYFVNITKATIDYRKKNNVSRNDFLQLLLTLREQEKSGKLVNISHELKEEDAYLKQEEYKPTNDEDNLELTDEVMAAQAFLFLTAGSETVSMTTSLVMFSLSTHPEVQKKAQQEIDDVLAKHGAWNYQAVKDMTYLDQVIQEGLRLQPFLVNLQRVVTSPYKIPGTNLTLEKNTRINIPVYPIHMDPRVYPDPHKFDPDRFKDNNHKTSWRYLIFGDGPRMCIGMRFALLEMKLCLARVLSQFSMTLSDKTRNPLVLDTRSFFPKPKDGIWLHFQERERNDAIKTDL